VTGKRRRQSVRDTLRQAIRDRGLTTRQAGALAGVDFTSIARFLNRKRGLATESIDKLADALGFDLTPREPKRRRE